MRAIVIHNVRHPRDFGTLYVEEGDTVRPAASMEEWAQYMADFSRRLFLVTAVGKDKVSTISLGVDSVWGPESDPHPYIFETCIRVWGQWTVVHRYPTRAEAESGHAGACDALANRPPVPPTDPF